MFSSPHLPTSALSEALLCLMTDPTGDARLGRYGMWTTTLLKPALDLLAVNARVSSSPSGLNFQPRGFRVNSWKAVQSASSALSTAMSIEPAMDTWKPMRGSLTDKIERMWV